MVRQRTAVASRESSLPSRFRLLTFLALIPIAGAAHAAAAPRDAAPGVSFEAWLEPARISVGEPIVLAYRFTNRTRAAVALNLVDEEGWLGVRVTDARGVPIAAPVAHGAPRAGARPAGLPDLVPVVPAGGAFSERAVLNGRCALAGPGAYRVALNVLVRYGQGKRAMAGEVTGRRELTLSVDPANPDHLRASAKLLRARAASAPTPRERGRAVEELFALPAEAARPCWRQLVCDEARPDVALYAIDHLARRGDQTAVDLLATAWESQHAPAVRAEARTALLGLWWNGDGRARSGVESVFTAREGVMPPVEAPPLLGG